MKNVLGIVSFENDTTKIQGINEYHNMATTSFLGRYRLIDFILSNMTNSGIENIQIYTKKAAKSLYGHVKEGSHYNINAKKGSLNIFPVEGSEIGELYNHDLACFNKNLRYIKEAKQDYILIAPSHFIYKVDFKDVLKNHIEKGNDISILYSKEKNCKVDFLNCNKLMFDDNNQVKSIKVNNGKYNLCDISLDAYFMSKEMFLKLAIKYKSISELYCLRDMVSDYCNKFIVKGYKVKGNVVCINSIQSYLNSALELKKGDNLRKYYDEDWPLLTITKDSSPTYYGSESSIKGSMIANGCIIDGHVENCVLGRNVVIKKGARVTNSIILADSYIGENATLDYVVVDKDANVFHIKELIGTKENPIYVQRFGII